MCAENDAIVGNPLPSKKFAKNPDSAIEITLIFKGFRHLKSLTDDYLNKVLQGCTRWEACRILLIHKKIDLVNGKW